MRLPGKRPPIGLRSPLRKKGWPPWGSWRNGLPMGTGEPGLEAGQRSRLRVPAPLRHGPGGQRESPRAFRNSQSGQRSRLSGPRGRRAAGQSSRSSRRRCRPAQWSSQPALYFLDRKVDFLLGIQIDAAHFLQIAEVKGRRPGVRHFHAEICCERKSFFLHDLVGEASCLSRRRSVCGEKPQVSSLFLRCCFIIPRSVTCSQAFAAL